MEEAPVTAATGALGPVIAKLAALLGSEYKLRWRTRRDVKFIRSKLRPVHSILWNIWEREELDEASKELKMEALDLADELDDAIFDFIVSMERSRDNKRFVQTKIKASPFHDFKKRASDVSGRCRSNWKEKEKPDDSFPGKPRAYPFVRKHTSELKSMAEPFYELIQHLKAEEKTTPVQMRLKTAIICGPAGMGKTTLADLVYQAVGDQFQSRAFVSLTSGGNMREVLSSIIQQLEANSSEQVPGAQAATEEHVAADSSEPLVGAQQAIEEEHLMDIIWNFLKEKRYLVIIDDIWNWREWEVIMKSLPENNLGSRIVGATRINAVAQKWINFYDDPKVSAKENKLLIHLMAPDWDGRKGWVYNIGGKNIFTEMLCTKADLVMQGYDNEHSIGRMCGGMPLAAQCLLSALTQERDKQAQQGIHAKPRDLQDKIEKHVMENGIQNTPGFEPLVDSLQLGFDDLPHHMLKTCLLYCSIYPDGHIFYKYHLVRRWISEGFAYTEEEANSYFDELDNRGLILRVERNFLRMHPMMRNFLRTKSRENNFTTCSSEITSSYTCRIRRLCIDNSPCRYKDAAVDPLSALDWYHVRSLVVCEGMERAPFEKMEGLRVLDLCRTTALLDHHWKDICGLVRLRHLLLCLDGDTICELPPEIVKLQCLETFEASGKGLERLPGFIGNLQQLKTLEVRHATIKEVPCEIAALLQLETLRIKNTHISQLPKEIGKLQQLKTLDISTTGITVLPREIGELQQLKTLDISSTRMTVLPKEIRKLQQLEHLLMTDTKVAKIPREIGALKKLKSLELDDSITALPLEVCTWVELPECIHQALNKSALVSELAREMISFRRSINFSVNAGIVVGAKQMQIPLWIREHFNAIALLDIRICILDDEGLKILREMPNLKDLTLRFQVVPREPVVISSHGFAKLGRLTVDSLVPRVIFQEGALPKLQSLTFQFQFYAGPPNKDPVGINHLRRLEVIYFECNEDWYGGGDSPCIRPTIDVVRKEAQMSPRWVGVEVCGRHRTIYRSLPPSHPPPLEMGQQRDMEQGETKEDIQA